jgi:putative YphP/YqiW family bacilliredoxin
VRTPGNRDDGRELGVRLRGGQGAARHRAWRWSTRRRPDVVATVFAGADIEATERAREYFAPYPPSSPSVGLMRDGKLVFMLQRRDIETTRCRADRGAS